MNQTSIANRTGWHRVRLVDPEGVLVEIVPCPTFAIAPHVIVKGVRAFVRAEGEHGEMDTYREVFAYWPPATSEWRI